MLSNALDGVGSDAHTTVFLDRQGEYMLQDTRYFHSHTFIPRSENDEAGLLIKLRKRTTFLRDKLLAELRQGNKVFVFRPSDGAIDDHTISRMHAALRRHGNAWLMCVRNADDGQEEDSFEDRGDGLLVGVMLADAASRGDRHPSGPAAVKNYPRWLTLCRAALIARDQSQVPAAPNPTPPIPSDGVSVLHETNTLEQSAIDDPLPEREAARAADPEPSAQTGRRFGLSWLSRRNR